MTKAEFEKLVTEYGVMSWKCGVYDSDSIEFDVIVWDGMLKNLAAAKQAVLDAFDNKESE